MYGLQNDLLMSPMPTASKNTTSSGYNVAALLSISLEVTMNVEPSPETPTLLLLNI